MIAIDSNVLVRILVDDPAAEEQCRLARAWIAKHDGIWVSKIVLIETVWVLQTNYQFNKTQIAFVLDKLSHHSYIRLENAADVIAGLELFNNSNVGFADCLIINDAQRRQLMLYTFDRKLGALPGAENLAKVQL